MADEYGDRRRPAGGRPDGREDDLAYGDYNDGERAAQGEGDRGIISDTFNRIRGRHHRPPGETQDVGGMPPLGNPQAQYQNPNVTQTYQPQLYNQGQAPPPQPGPSDRPQKPITGMTSLLSKVHETVHSFGTDVAQRVNQATKQTAQHSHTHYGAECEDGIHDSSDHRYRSFAPKRTGNDAKWYVDGCGYMWAVSRALECAEKTIWILDWWLSPELYLRRPPSKFEAYRLDRMLLAAAERGVKVNIIVYKEVTQALTRKYLTPTLPDYLHSLLPRSTDSFTSLLSRLGLEATFASLEHIETENPLMAPPVTVCSSHTKHHLEDMHRNICVFRHPDHLPDATSLQSNFVSSFKNLSLNAAAVSKMQPNTLKSIYGMSDDVILYWAHHEKLLLVDGQMAFMGGLDLCYGRWDTHDHPIADAHPGNLDNILFPGQDFNNARVMDFDDVPHWQNNKLDRTNSSRMGWSDVSLCLRGPVVEDLASHFVDRWNLIYNEKYDVRQDDRYTRLHLREHIIGVIPHLHHGHHSGDQPSPQPYSAPGDGQADYVPPSQGLPSGYPPQDVRPPVPTGPPRPYNPQEYSQSPAQPVQPSQVQQQYPQQYGRPAQPPSAPQGSQEFPPPPTQQQFPPPPSQEYQPQTSQQFPPPPSSAEPDMAGPGPGPYFPPPPGPEARGIDDAADYRERGVQRDESRHRRHHWEGQEGGLRDRVLDRVSEGVRRAGDEYERRHGQYQGYYEEGGVACQIVRSCAKWSHGGALEHSIANAYIGVIQNSQHFVYIENQFFITATHEAQKPVKNKIGAAIVDRIIRAARAGEKYKVIVVMPAVPAFAGDLKDEASLGTRAIMEFQYNSINRGGHSIMETLAQNDIDPTQYIRFYNLRNYDRINASAAMTEAEQKSGVKYEDARRQHDDMVGAGFGGHGEGTGAGQYAAPPPPQFQQYQDAAQTISRRQGLGDGKWDSVSECYMHNGPDIRGVPWENGETTEMDAFVSEELYVHSKLLIADDRVVICGSANLNDRSQLGYHDSEIAIIIEDPTPVDSYMNGQPWRASLYATTLRREVFRKHLGMIPPQDPAQPDQNFEPVGIPNGYDWGSPEDQAVIDPLSDNFNSLWNRTAQVNTNVLGRIFHAVPNDKVRNWKEYDEFYTKHFHAQGTEKEKLPPKYKWGHVVKEDFPPGEQGLRQVKDMLSTVKGTLVEMPLLFLIEEDIAQEGVSLNAFTEEVYT